MKTLFVDCETTGTEKGQHALIQLAGCIVIDSDLTDTFDMRMRPFPNSSISDEALKINGRSRAEIGEWPDHVEIKGVFEAMLNKHVDRFDRKDKFQLCGFNCSFDSDFIRAWFELCGDTYFGSWFWWPPIDVAQLAAIRLQRVRHRMSNFKLETVASELGVELSEAHEAKSDIRATMQIMKVLMCDMPWVKG